MPKISYSGTPCIDCPQGAPNGDTFEVQIRLPKFTGVVCTKHMVDKLKRAKELEPPKKSKSKKAEKAATG